jgi:glycosyltransferase involved in cell wall biosynthesis
MTADTNITSTTFVVPTYNEAELLPQTLQAIQEYVIDISYEIIVVDNGSTDSTLEIAQQLGARVFRDTHRTIGDLRNLGAAHANGNLLVFIDADVVLTKKWVEEFRLLSANNDGNDHLITGSRCDVSIDPGWIEKYWFKPMTEERGGYINSGHMIIGRKAFFELGGFDEKLITGEDWEFCSRAKRKGFSIVKNPRLHVIHEGYPKNLKAFVSREMWHGVQDFSDLQAVFSSRVALGAMVYWFIGIAGVLLALYNWSSSWLLIVFVLNSTLCLMATLSKRRQYRLSIFPYFLLFHVYFFARGLSIIKRLGKILPRSRK